ncbi:MAG TPA: superoxide dismutase [Woeseiaceae bacterium]|nr:superoxide dismutase [Woeseiaceae bacterium]
MTFELPELPYRADALEPFLSKQTLDTHHGKHHRGYINKLNELIDGTDYQDLSLQEIVVRAKENGDTAIFNNAAQSLNHGFLWESMSPDGGSPPAGPLGDAIDAAFGNLKGFKEAFKAKALTQFGSGWVWLVVDSGGLKIVQTGNADTPVQHGVQPILTLDVWEHAYYLDYKNDRGGYVDSFLSDRVNWAFAARNFESIKAAA